MKRLGTSLCILVMAVLLLLAAGSTGLAQQNPSPMVEHTRAHPRLAQESPPGKREKLTVGTIFLPEKVALQGRVPLLVHFHGSPWVADVAAARQGKWAVLTVQLGSGSATYARPFADARAFGDLLQEAESKSGAKWGPVYLSCWSAGYGAIRAILGVPEYYERVQGVLLLDGLHTGYVGGKPGPKESVLEEEGLAVFLKLARDAADGKKLFLLTHTEIFPGTFASTTETADYLLQKLDIRRTPVLKWGPMGTQQLGEARKGKFTVLGFAGNSAPDHVDLLHAMPDLLKLME